MPKVGGESYLLLAHSRGKKLKACPEILSKSKSYIVFLFAIHEVDKKISRIFLLNFLNCKKGTLHPHLIYDRTTM